MASYLSPSSPVPLHDLGFDLIPQMNCLYLSDYLTILLAGTAAVRLLVFKKDIRPLRTISLIFERISVGYLVRSSMVFMTSLPDPRPSCERVTTGIWTTFQAHRCGGTISKSSLTVRLSLFRTHVSIRHYGLVLVESGILVWYVDDFIGNLWNIFGHCK